MSKPTLLLETLEVVEPAKGLGEIVLARKDGRPNFACEELFNDIDAAIEHLWTWKHWKGLLVSARGPVWLGALRLEECVQLQSRSQDQITRWALERNRTLVNLQDLPMPTVAVIDGPVMGAGLDLAMALDARIVTPRTVMGLPEVEYGFIPFGMSPLRMAQHAGIARTLAIACTGQRLTAKQAAGDKLAVIAGDVAEAHKKASAYTKDEYDSASWKHQRATAVSEPAVTDPRELAPLAEHARKQIAQHLGNFAPAQFEILRAVEELGVYRRDVSVEGWSTRFAEVARTSASRALMRLSRANDLIRVKLERNPAREQAAGALVLIADSHEDGRLAGQLAGRWSARASVTLLASSQDQGQRARKQAASVVARRCVGDPDRAKDELARFAFVLDEAKVPTEAIRIGLGFQLDAPWRKPDLAGDPIDPNESDAPVRLSFFPLQWRPSMSLVSVGHGCSADQMNQALLLAARLGFPAVPAKSTPAGVVYRILMAGVVAVDQVIAHGASFQTADIALTRDGWSAGLCALLDALPFAQWRHLHTRLGKAFPDRFGERSYSATALLAEADVRFYQDGTANQEAVTLIEATRDNPPKAIMPSAIAQSLLNAMSFEAMRCVEEKLVASASELDLLMVRCGIYPRHVGGPIYRASMVGYAQLVSWSQKSERDHPIYAAPAILKRHASNKTLIE